MRKEYDFSKAKPNPYARRLKRSVTIRLDDTTVEYFKELAGRTSIPYQSLINLYLRDCAANRRELSVAWPSALSGSLKASEASGTHIVGRRKAAKRPAGTKGKGK